MRGNCGTHLGRSKAFFYSPVVKVQHGNRQSGFARMVRHRESNSRHIVSIFEFSARMMPSMRLSSSASA